MCTLLKFMTLFFSVNITDICTYGDVRLVDGTNPYEGRVEVCISDQWGTVCDNQWDTTDATTVCKQLGLSYTGSKFSCITYLKKNYDRVNIPFQWEWQLKMHTLELGWEP